MPPASLMRLKYALMPSASCAYLPPTGFVFDVITDTRIVVSVTPFTPGSDTCFLRSAGFAVVCGDFGALPLGCELLLVLAFEHAAASMATANPVTTTFGARIVGSPRRRSNDHLSMGRECGAGRPGRAWSSGRMFTMLPLWENGTFISC